MKARKILAALSTACLVGVGLVATAGGATAADGQEFIVNGDFTQYDHATGGINDGVTMTDFALTTSLNEASSPNTGDMYDPGRYAISTNAGSLHNQWVEQAGDNPKMVLNGFTEGVQTVWAQEAPGVTCDVPGSLIHFEFTADVANVLPLDQYADGGANIQVFINGEPLGDSVDLTSNDGTAVPIGSNLIEAADTFLIEVRNSATVYIGNDFSLDNLSLVQVGECLAPVTPSFLAATPATCDAIGGIEGGTVFPRDMGDFTLSISPDFTGAGTYTLTATADEGFGFPAGTVTTAQITVDPLGYNLDCIPAIGGRTIGFWTNKNGTAVEKAGNLWAQVRAEYPVQTAGLTTFGAAQTFIKNANSTGTGITMLRAQFFATALNTYYLPGYGSQEFTVPVTSAIDGGQVVTVNQYLQDIKAGWATLDTKAEITSVQNVLNAINQDDPSLLFL